MFWLAHFYAFDGVCGVLVGVFGVLVGVLGVLIGILGVLVDAFLY